MELGGCVGDGDERYHDEIGTDFGLTSVHDAGMPSLDCTTDSILHLSWYAGLLCLCSFGWRLH